MALLTSLLGEWQRWTCSHQWVRARWDDGSYGLRCALCMRPYARTWNEIIAQPPLASLGAPLPASFPSPSAAPLAASLAARPAPASAAAATKVTAMPAVRLADLPSLRRAA